MQPYVTVLGAASDECVFSRSRFIGRIVPVTTEAEAAEVIRSVTKEHWDARHNVYAYCLREGNIARFSDDGEPQGTAGRPVLDVLTGSGVTDCIIIVTRYFGGVLLGTGGLVRAYSTAATLALKSAERVNMIASTVCTVNCDYNRYGRIQSLLSEFECVDVEPTFTDGVCVRFTVKTALLDSLSKKLTDLTAGSVKIVKIDEKYTAFSHF